MPAAVSASAPPVLAADPGRARILRQARADFFVHGYSRFTMDELAREVGMSKKTLYLHFTGKDQIIGAVIDDLAAEVRTAADTLQRDAKLTLAEKLRRFVAGMAERMARLQPHTLRDLQRFAPHLLAKIEEVRGTTIPYVFGRFVAEGQSAGLVHDHISAEVAIACLLHSLQGLMQPATLERLQLTPSAAMTTAIDLFFGGLLTNAGRKQYEKLPSR
jgi:AcrR family transcriptional regulator